MCYFCAESSPKISLTQVGMPCHQSVDTPLLHRPWKMRSTFCTYLVQFWCKKDHQIKYPRTKESSRSTLVFAPASFLAITQATPRWEKGAQNKHQLLSLYELAFFGGPRLSFYRSQRLLLLLLHHPLWKGTQKRLPDIKPSLEPLCTTNAVKKSKVNPQKKWQNFKHTTAFFSTTFMY